MQRLITEVVNFEPFFTTPPPRLTIYLPSRCKFARLLGAYLGNTGAPPFAIAASNPPLSDLGDRFGLRPNLTPFAVAPLRPSPVRFRSNSAMAESSV